VVLQHESLLLAVLVGLCELVFLFLYLRHSRYAWHAAVLISFSFGVYHLAFGRQPRVDIIIGGLILVYLFLIRQPYFDYVRVDPAVEKI